MSWLPQIFDLQPSFCLRFPYPFMNRLLASLWVVCERDFSVRHLLVCWALHHQKASRHFDHLPYQRDHHLNWVQLCKPFQFLLQPPLLCLYPKTICFYLLPKHLPPDAKIAVLVSNPTQSSAFCLDLSFRGQGLDFHSNQKCFTSQLPSIYLCESM